MKQYRPRPLVMVSLLGVAACRLGPSFDEYLELVKSRAGEGATDCGVAPLGQDRAPAVACSTAALTSRHPFFVIFQVQGIDSEIYYGLSINNEGGAWRALWDSDIYGGSRLTAKARMQLVLCENPRVVSDGLPVRCKNDLAGS